jgi:hypothetical protein
VAAPVKMGKAEVVEVEAVNDLMKLEPVAVGVVTIVGAVTIVTSVGVVMIEASVGVVTIVTSVGVVMIVTPVGVVEVEDVAALNGFGTEGQYGCKIWNVSTVANLTSYFLSSQ